MAMFVQIDETAGLLVLVAVLLGVWFTVAPDQATETVVSAKEAVVEVVA